MKKKIYHYILLLVTMFCNLSEVRSQTSSYFPPNIAAAPNTPLAAGDFLGWAAGSSPLVTSLDIRTNDIGLAAIPIDFFSSNTHRMRLHSSGQLSINTNLATDPLIGTYAPSLNVKGGSSFTLAGWGAAIKIDGGGALIFDKGAYTNYYFIAHPSAAPAGHTYYGLISAIDHTVTAQYIYKVHSVQLAAPNDAAQGTHQFGTGVYLWPINDATNALSSHYRPLLTQDVPPLYNAFTEPDADVWLYNIGLYQSRPFRGTTPVFSLSNTDEGIVLANQDGIFHTKLRFTGNSSDVLQGDGTWGPGSGFTAVRNALNIQPGNILEWGGSNPADALIHDTEV